MDKHSDKGRRDSRSTQSPQSTAKEDLRRTTEGAKEEVREGAEQAAEEVKERAQSFTSQAGEQTERTASALDSAAEELRAEGQEGLADTVSKLARSLGGLADELQHKSIDELLRDTGRLAQRNPLLFAAGSVAAGVMLSRFFKAKAPHDSYASRWDDAEDYVPYEDYVAEETYAELEARADELRAGMRASDSAVPPTQTDYGDTRVGQTSSSPPPSASPRESKGNGHSRDERGGER